MGIAKWCFQRGTDELTGSVGRKTLVRENKRESAGLSRGSAQTTWSTMGEQVAAGDWKKLHQEAIVIREAGVIQSQAVLTAIRDDWEGGARCSASTPRIIRGSRRQSVRYCPRAVGSATTCEGGSHFRSRMVSGRVAEIVKMPPLTQSDLQDALGEEKQNDRVTELQRTSRLRSPSIACQATCGHSPGGFRFSRSLICFTEARAAAKIAASSRRVERPARRTIRPLTTTVSAVGPWPTQMS